MKCKYCQNIGCVVLWNNGSHAGFRCVCFSGDEPHNQKIGYKWNGEKEFYCNGKIWTYEFWDALNKNNGHKSNIDGDNLPPPYEMNKETNIKDEEIPF